MLSKKNLNKSFLLGPSFKLLACFTPLPKIYILKYSEANLRVYFQLWSDWVSWTHGPPPLRAPPLGGTHHFQQLQPLPLNVPTTYFVANMITAHQHTSSNIPLWPDWVSTHMDLPHWEHLHRGNTPFPAVRYFCAASLNSHAFDLYILVNCWQRTHGPPPLNAATPTKTQRTPSSRLFPQLPFVQSFCLLGKIIRLEKFQINNISSDIWMKMTKLNLMICPFQHLIFRETQNGWQAVSRGRPKNL